MGCHSTLVQASRKHLLEVLTERVASFRFTLAKSGVTRAQVVDYFCVFVKTILRFHFISHSSRQVLCKTHSFLPLDPDVSGLCIPLLIHELGDGAVCIYIYIYTHVYIYIILSSRRLQPKEHSPPTFASVLAQKVVLKARNSWDYRQTSGKLRVRKSIVRESEPSNDNR